MLARLSVSCRGILITVHRGIFINIGDIDKSGRKKKSESRKRQKPDSDLFPPT